MFTILAIIGLCVILSKMSRFFTKLGNIFDNIGNKITKRDYHKEYIRFAEATKNKALRKARNEILDADYEKRLKEEIETLTK